MSAEAETSVGGRDQNEEVEVRNEAPSDPVLEVRCHPAALRRAISLSGPARCMTAPMRLYGERPGNPLAIGAPTDAWHRPRACGTAACGAAPLRSR